MAQRSLIFASVVSARRQRVRSILIASLVQAMNATQATQLAVARWTGTTPATIRRWLGGLTPINVEAVLASARLAKPFRVALCVHEHEATAGYVVKAKRSTRK